MSLPHEVRVQTARVATDRFVLTGAIRPARGSSACPTVGFRRHAYEESPALGNLALLLIAVSRDDILPLLFDLLDALGPSMTVALCRSAARPDEEPEPTEYRRHEIDGAVLKSVLVEYEDLLLNDGLMTLSAFERPGREVRLDEHKNLIVFAKDPTPFVEVLAACGVPERPDLSLVSDWKHVHFSTEAIAADYDAFVERLGAEAESEATDETD